MMIVRKHLYKRHHPKSSGLTNHIQPLSTWMNCWNSSSVQAWENQEHPTTLGDAREKNHDLKTPIIYGGDQIIIIKSSSQKWTVTDYSMYVFF